MNFVYINALVPGHIDSVKKEKISSLALVDADGLDFRGLLS